MSLNLSMPPQEAAAPPHSISPTQPTPFDARTSAYGVQFEGSGRDYFRVWLANLLLTIVTLGLYTPFARWRTLAYFLNHTALAGSSFEFVARKLRMFLGFLLVVGLAVASQIAQNSGNHVLSALLILSLAALAPYLWASAMRFRLGNTRWRGLRMHFLPDWKQVYAGSWPMFVVVLAWVGLNLFVGDKPMPATRPSWPLVGGLAAMCLASLLCAIQLDYNYKHLLLQRSFIGQEQGRWEARYQQLAGIWLRATAIALATAVACYAAAGALLYLVVKNVPQVQGLFISIFGIMLLVLLTFLLLIVALLPALAYKQAAMFKLLWNHIRIGQLAHFESTLSVPAYLRLKLKNAVLNLVTLGFYRPLARTSEYAMRFNSLTMHLSGDLDDIRGRLLEQQEHGLGDALVDAAGLDFIG